MPPQTPVQPQYQPPHYPEQTPYPTAPQPGAQQASNGIAIAGLVLAFLVAPVGLILSIVALATHRYTAKAMPVVGIIIGALGTAVVPLLMLLVFLSVPALQKNANDTLVASNASSLSASVDYYYTTNPSASYPSSAEMTDQSWVATNLTDLNKTTSADYFSKPDIYAYEALPAGCTNTTESPCTSYSIAYKTSKGIKTLPASSDLPLSTDSSD